MNQKAEEVLMTVGGEPFITREEFERISKEPGAPKDYTYDQYVADSMETADEAYEREKAEWIAANQQATPEEYTQAMRRLADELGV